MHQHDQSSHTDVVHTPGEGQQHQSRTVVDDLLPEVLSFDVKGHTEEQRAIEAQLQNVVPILRV